MDSVFQFWFRTIPEYFKKIEKLKNCFLQGHSGRDSPCGFSFSVLVRELFRNIAKRTEKQFFQGHSGRDSPYGFSFSVLVRELFRNICGKTVKLFFFPGTFRKRFSIWIQLFSFSAGTTV